MFDISGYLTDLKKLISFKSVNGEKSKGAPFGVEVKNALIEFLDIAKGMGFNTVNYDNYVGEVFFGDGEEVGIMGHLDVVPAVGEWESDPFTLTKKNNVYYGRGVVDDKGPILLNLYALNDVKNSGVMPKRKIRLFVGTNEETGWQDVEYLKTKTTMPVFGFSPDGNFPMCYAEKGISILKVKIPTPKNLLSIKGGSVINAVCDYAVATFGFLDDSVNKLGLIKQGNTVISKGKAAHGSLPEQGVNAIKPLIELLSKTDDNAKNLLELFNDAYGIKKLSNEQGFITLSPDIIELDKDGLSLSCDIRIPAPFTQKDVEKILEKTPLDYEIKEKHPPMMVEKDGWFIKALKNAYDSITGENARPISMGGSTFARAFMKGSAFGIETKEENNHIHEPNECISENLLKKSYEIYKQAIINLIK